MCSEACLCVNPGASPGTSTGDIQLALECVPNLLNKGRAADKPYMHARLQRKGICCLLGIQCAVRDTSPRGHRPLQRPCLEQRKRAWFSSRPQWRSRMQTRAAGWHGHAHLLRPSSTEARPDLTLLLPRYRCSANMLRVLVSTDNHLVRTRRSVRTGICYVLCAAGPEWTALQ